MLGICSFRSTSWLISKPQISQFTEPHVASTARPGLISLGCFVGLFAAVFALFAGSLIGKEEFRKGSITYA
jgi:hypothetical protein